MASQKGQSLAELAQRYDRSNMATVIERLPVQIETALAQTLPPVSGGPYRSVMVCGMGGSALPVEVLLDAFDGRLRIPLTACRSYSVPEPADPGRLYVFSSFSGNTEEVLSALEPFPAGASNVIVITHGGKLAEMAARRGYGLVRIPVELEPSGFQPRSAVGYFVTYLARLVSLAGGLDRPEQELRRVPPFLASTAIRPEAERAAEWLKGRIPVVYTDERHLMSIARVAKIKFNENSKRPAFFNALPEANHNEMIGFTLPLGSFGVLYLHDNDSHPRIRRRFLVMREVFAKEGISNVGFYEWGIPDGTRIEKVFAGLAFADWCSYALALLSGMDPSPVPLIESFKRSLA
jgi:glucose/mannose-6-phosphate isomerase